MSRHTCDAACGVCLLMLGVSPVDDLVTRDQLGFVFSVEPTPSEQVGHQMTTTSRSG